MTTQDQILELHRSNPSLTAKEIAEALGCNQGHVWKTAYRFNFKPGSAAIYDTLWHKLSDDERLEYVVSMAEKGGNLADVCAGLNVSKVTIHYLLKRHNRSWRELKGLGQEKNRPLSDVAATHERREWKERCIQDCERHLEALRKAYPEGGEAFDLVIPSEPASGMAPYATMRARRSAAVAVGGSPAGWGV